MIRERLSGIHRDPFVQLENAGNEQEEPEEEANGSQGDVHNAVIRATGENYQQFERDDVGISLNLLSLRAVEMNFQEFKSVGS